jgi:hypothetical protein
VQRSAAPVTSLQGTTGEFSGRWSSALRWGMPGAFELCGKRVGEGF